jgi:hypothetical protein
MEPCHDDVYATLAVHQAREPWAHQALVAELASFAELMKVEFKLNLPPYALLIDRLRGRLGHWRYVHNGFGLAKELAIDERHAAHSMRWRVLGTLLHELLHGWQDRNGRHGRGNYHNKEYRTKAADFGLVVDSRGYTQYRDGVFTEFLRRHGVEVPTLHDGPELDAPHRPLGGRGTSKLKKWTCACPVNVRVAVPNFRARCLACCQEFCRAE